MEEKGTCNLLTILGPTATGKTALAAHLAYHLDGEVISADSRQVYRGMDIGTGKDMADYWVEGKQIPVHLTDIVEAGTQYNVFEYQHNFLEVLDDLRQRKKLPVLCGGSGLYIEAVLRNYTLIQVPVNENLRLYLAGKSLDELTEILKSYTSKLHNITDIVNEKRAVRAIEIAEYQQREEERRTESGERKAENGERKAENGERRAENGERRAESGERRAENGERRAENGERRAENGERRAENGERRAESGEQRVITDHRIPNTDYRSPISDYQSPITNAQCPITNDQLPMTDYRSPITDHRLPITADINPLIVGIHFDRDTRRERITQRLHQRLNEGMVEEVRKLLDSGISPEELIYYGLEYKYITFFLTGAMSYPEMVEKLNIAIHQFAKRQMTWFRRMERQGTIIHWIDGNLPIEGKMEKVIGLLEGRS